MIRREDDRAILSGAVTLANVSAVHEEGRALIADGVAQVDLAGVTELDSSLLAALLSWQRDAQARGQRLAVANVPEGLATIARLYGVDTLLAGPTAS